MRVAQRFFDALTRGHHTMGQRYAPDAAFSDPIFPLLSAEEVRLMGRLLLVRARDLSVSASVDERPGGARTVWVARCSVRPVRPRVYAEW